MEFWYRTIINVGFKRESKEVGSVFLPTLFVFVIFLEVLLMPTKSIVDFVHSAR